MMPPAFVAYGGVPAAGHRSGREGLGILACGQTCPHVTTSRPGLAMHVALMLSEA